MRRFFGSTGSVSRVTVESRALETNMLGDPSARVVDVYVPAGHDGQGLPLLVDLVGFTGSGLSHTNWVGFRENLPERLDRLIARWGEGMAGDAAERGLDRRARDPAAGDQRVRQIVAQARGVGGVMDGGGDLGHVFLSMSPMTVVKRRSWLASLSAC